MKLIKTVAVAIFLVGCASTKPAVCPAIYDPHLCLLTVNGDSFGGYGRNKCEAVNHLKRNLDREGISADLSKVECGRAMNMFSELAREE